MEIRPAVLTFVFAALSVLTMFLPSTAQEGPKTEAPKTVAVQQRVFVFVQRTDRHAKHSSQEMFHDAMNAVFDYLKQKNVAIAVDDFGGRNHAEGATPMETVFSIARDAKADTVLWVEVDRPLSKWLKVTIQCYDMNNKLLWEEKAESGGGFSGAHGLEVTTKRIQEGLDKHIAQPGLPVLAKDATPSAEAQ
jgi:hypothetical protein